MRQVYISLGRHCSYDCLSLCPQVFVTLVIFTLVTKPGLASFAICMWFIKQHWIYVDRAYLYIMIAA